MRSTLRAMLEPLGFQERESGAWLRGSDAGRIQQVVAPFCYPSGAHTVEVGFLCPDLTRLALPDLDLYEPIDVALCDAGLGFSFRLETLLEERAREGWRADELAPLVAEQLPGHLSRLCVRYATLTGWLDHYDERLEAYGSALDWAIWAWIQLVRGEAGPGLERAIRAFASGARGRFGDELERLHAAYEERHGALDLSEAERPFE
ncbi:MAG: hypothetical protein AB7N76_36040 [Planctomycetota bacterium]